MGLSVYAVLSIDENKEERQPLTKESYDIYFDMLNKMISHVTVTMIEEKFGERFRNSKSIADDIENGEILNVVKEAAYYIINSMGIPMKEFLYTYFGRTWIQDFIKKNVMMLAVKYTSEKIKGLR
jgi:hypothetical protein